MKKTFTPIILLLLSIHVFAQVPEKISYQAVVRDAANELVANQTVGVEISILQGSASGGAVFIETHTPQSNDNGLVTFQIGNGNVVLGDFSTIDWGGDSYFVQTDIDPDGGINYTITGTQQLLSVPYALRAKTAETYTGTIIETDPVFSGSVASNITQTDLDNWNDPQTSLTGNEPVFDSWDKDASDDFDSDYNSLVNAPDLSIYTTTDTTLDESEVDGFVANNGFSQQSALEDTASQIRSDIPDVSGFVTSETDPSVPTGTQTGEMQFWNGSEWITVAAGSEGQVLTFSDGEPVWLFLTPQLVAGEVFNPTTGEVWMDKNLGASQVATSSTDAASYGDLYQWGRAADGHESRTSGTTTMLSSTDSPGHGDFIISGSFPNDWRSPQNDNLWQGVSGTNNPCPSGYRLPTEAEWEAERTTWSTNNAAGAFASPLKLPAAGGRNYSSGALNGVGFNGGYWSSTIGLDSRYLLFYSSFADMYSEVRARGLSVRCLKD